MIIATAGHVDHGKTSLVRALTGIDTDRLPEEQRRGLTIEPGFAQADFGSGAVAFVDVPGHERFLRQMIAGVAAVHAVLLVVAADDGPMPQTREHLAVLQLLGVQQGAVVLSKADRVDADRLAQVAAQVVALLQGTALAGVPVLPVSAPSGAGLPALQAQLAAWRAAWQPPPAHGGFRMVVDRAFTQPGAGRVVTGTVLAGTVRRDEGLMLSPQGLTVRVRGLQVQGVDVAQVQAGQRCALNLVGAERADIGRGSGLVAPALHAPTQRLDVRLRLLPEAPARGWQDRALHLHLGTAALPVRAVPLQPGLPAPGGEGWVQLVLPQPVDARWGDRFVLRDGGALLGGGVVVDPAPPARGRARPARLDDLQALALPDAADALAALLAAHPQGVEWPPLARARNQAPDAPWPATVPAQALAHERGLRVLSPAAWRATLQAVDDTLAAWHGEHPHALGPDEVAFQAALHARLAGTVDAPVRHAALRQRLADGAVRRQGFHLRLPGHQPQLSEADQALLQRVRDVMAPMGLRPPPLGELAPLLGLALADAGDALQRMAALGHLVQVAKNRFFLPEVMDGLVQVLRDTAAAAPDGRFDAAGYRDRSGVGRNLTIQLLEFFDRRGLTRFANERRTLA